VRVFACACARVCTCKCVRACVRACVCVWCVCVRVCVHVCICVRRYMYLYICMYIYIYTHTHTHTHTHTYIWIYIYMYLSLSLSLSIHMHIYTYIYTYTGLYMCIQTTKMSRYMHEYIQSMVRELRSSASFIALFWMALVQRRCSISGSLVLSAPKYFKHFPSHVVGSLPYSRIIKSIDVVSNTRPPLNTSSLFERLLCKRDLVFWGAHSLCVCACVCMCVWCICIHIWPLHTKEYMSLTFQMRHIERWGAGVEYHFQEIQWALRPVVNGT